MFERNGLGDEEMKATIATEWLSGCAGCHIAVADLHEKLLVLMKAVEFVRSPVLMDEKDYPAADIGLVEGAVRNEHDREALKKMREKVKTLIAFGTCAVYGGPSGIGWLHDRREIMEQVYQNGPTNCQGEWPDENAVPLENSVLAIDEVVPVDIYLPGCPPHPLFIAGALRAVLDKAAPPLTNKSVCSECSRKMRKNPGATLQKGAVTGADPDLCLLSQGVLCLGSVTLNRCLSPCPKKGIACSGCAGPSLDIVAEPQLDMRTLISKRLHLLTGIDPAETQKYFEQNAKTFYSYVLASPVIYKKPTVEILEWAGLDQEHKA
jgi:F420-non-reducing hydrogenase small subunit